jgi:hypothetical protein
LNHADDDEHSTPHPPPPCKSFIPRGGFLNVMHALNHKPQNSGSPPKFNDFFFEKKILLGSLVLLPSPKKLLEELGFDYYPFELFCK